MIGTIQQANKSKSGKTLSLQVDNVWYTSKNWELEQACGKRVIFEPSTQSFPDGGSCQWLNDYVFEDQSTTPSGQAMERAMADQSQTITKGAAITVNRDASIVAQALTKASASPGEPFEDVWNRYTRFYHLYMARNHEWTIPY